MFVTLINTLAIIFGSLLGLLLCRFIKKEVFETVMQIMGLTTIVIAITTIIKNLVTVDINGYIIIPDLIILVFILCVVIGTFIGELLKIEDAINKFGMMIENKINKPGFSKGFVFGTIIYCVGAMSIVGSIEASTGDYNTLYMKSILDGVSAIILASSLGYGVIFSGVSVLLYQGLITLIGQQINEYLTPEFLSLFSMVGYVMVLAIGVNFLFKDKFKVSNMLPSLLLVIIYTIIRSFI